MEFLHDGNTAMSSGPRMDPIAILYGSIFTGTLESAKTASVALQAVLTMVTTNYYYENLGHFDMFGDSIVQNAQPVIVPMTNTGLMTVYGIIGLHFVTVGAVFWVYFTFCARPLKFLDQAWQTVGLLHCGDANAFLGDTINKGDKDVGKLPLAEENWDTLVKISENGITYTPTKENQNTLVKYSTNDKKGITCRTTGYNPIRSSQGMYQTFEIYSQKSRDG
jgi:hypothetical protein